MDKDLSQYEIMAPIGSRVSLAAAIQAGADSIYFGIGKLKLSARAYGRILKVARTIADLAGSPQVELNHIAETVGYRNLDRGDWAERTLF